MRRGLCAILASTAIASFGLGDATGVAQSADYYYTFGPDDVVAVSLLDQDPKYSREVTVRPDGRITLPLIDDVSAGGLTPPELKEALKKAYAKYFEEPVLFVEAKQINSRRIYIMGEVQRPGAYNLTVPLTIVQFIGLAGGLKDWADKETIILIRKDPLPNGKANKIHFNYKKMFGRGADAIPMIEVGDQVLVR